MKISVKTKREAYNRAGYTFTPNAQVIDVEDTILGVLVGDNALEIEVVKEEKPKAEKKETKRVTKVAKK